jgi:hypothetical protein
MSSPASASPPWAPTQQRRKGRGVAAGHRLHEAGIALQDPGRVQGRDLDRDPQALRMMELDRWIYIYIYNIEL